MAFSQSMYRWVDEKGVTHFSETPPPEGARDAAKIEVRPAAPDRAPVDNWKQREAEAKQRRAVQANQDEAAQKQEEQQRATRCRDAQRYADQLQHTRRIFHLDEKGERVYLDENQRAADLVEAKQNVARYCR